MRSAGAGITPLETACTRVGRTKSATLPPPPWKVADVPHAFRDPPGRVEPRCREKAWRQAKERTARVSCQVRRTRARARDRVSDGGHSGRTDRSDAFEPGRRALGASAPESGRKKSPPSRRAFTDELSIPRVASVLIPTLVS